MLCEWCCFENAVISLVLAAFLKKGLDTMSFHTSNLMVLLGFHPKSSERARETRQSQEALTTADGRGQGEGTSPHGYGKGKDEKPKRLMTQRVGGFSMSFVDFHRFQLIPNDSN